ncbi:hypothetical protein D3C80_1174500 [compost metagenome]
MVNQVTQVINILLNHIAASDKHHEVFLFLEQPDDLIHIGVPARAAGVAQEYDQVGTRDIVVGQPAVDAVDRVNPRGIDPGHARQPETLDRAGRFHHVDAKASLLAHQLCGHGFCSPGTFAPEKLGARGSAVDQGRVRSRVPVGEIIPQGGFSSFDLAVDKDQ